MLLRGAGAGAEVGRVRDLSVSRPLPLDAAVVPGLLLLIARDLALFDPPRVLAWRLLHDPRLAEAPGWLRPLLPAPSGAIDRDPIALLLAAAAVGLALLYAGLGLFGARAHTRAIVIALASLLLVVLPSASFVAVGLATDRPYGQDGGVVQLPLALDKILAGESPYGADYSGTILARQARVSSFWEARGGNPILRHHAYLPGTHLVMMPFHLVARATLGSFDPRFVTLLFYALVIALTARLPEGASGRLAAAGLAALNPLVYWHQIFGANDLVFVAMLLGAVLAARGGRPGLTGGLLGLACATKQLAWPFAPFFFLALSGSSGLRDLADRTTWLRLLRPIAAAAAVFVVVVVPVAALDVHAFWADIVVYNAGLPGADNYPLGGTPGFGFANYLIYFGAVSSLRDHFPFSVFYLLLLPLGLVLLRSQLRDGRPEWSLVTGSAALLASLYFSRVVHPNYLIPLAVLLPVGLLARRRSSDLALVPLLLLAVAVEIAEGAVLRATGEQAAAAGIPARLGGVAGALAPRAGPTLSDDPLGLLFSATAAGLALLYLAVGVAGGGRKLRAGMVALAAVLVCAAPLLVVVRVGERTGVPRSQDAWPIQARADAARILSGRSPYATPLDDTPRGHEAFSASFRLDPPVEWRPERPLVPPGSAVLAALARLGGGRDPRLLVALALAALAALAAARDGPRTSALALTLLTPPLLLGTVFGSPVALPLALLVGAGIASAGGRSLAAGLLAGLAAGVDHRAAFAMLPLLPLDKGAREARRTLAGAAAGYAALTLPAIFPDPGAFVDRLTGGFTAGPGLGLANLFAYRGAETSSAVMLLAALAPLVLLGAGLALRRLLGPPLAAAGLVWLLALVLAPECPPDAVAAPITLLGLAALGTETPSTM